MSFYDSPIIPSVNANDEYDFMTRLMKISFSHSVHIDIRDGEFVSPISFQFGEEFSFKNLKHFTNVEVHLMVTDPTPWIEYLSDVTNLFIVHVEIPNIGDIIQLLKSKGKQVGLAINPQTDVESLEQYLEQADQVTIMTIQPGLDGSQFIPETLAKVKYLSEMYPKLIIECDGSMNEHTITRAKAAGVDLFVAGSVLQTADHPERKFQLLNELIKND